MISLPKRLPTRHVPAGSRWMRIHLLGTNPLWFGPVAGGQPIHRFDDPDGGFRVCYLGTGAEVCFAETFLRNPPVRILSLDDLAERGLATVEVRRELRLVPVLGASLARLGVTAEMASGGDYDGSQLWSRALWEHGDQVDGILYRSRHDDSTMCVAVYDRARDGLALVGDDCLTDDAQRLARILRRYGVGLTK